LLIAGLHRLIPDWELAGNLVSAFLGTGAIVSVYLLTREVFRRRDLALGAAALTAIHPDLAAYAASVRTEAGYIFVTTTAVWLILKARRENRVTMAALAGAIAGVAYLYRTEAIGLIFLLSAFLPVAALIWRDKSLAKSLQLSATFALVALIFVTPYALFLHSRTNHWSVGREFNAAMMFGMGSAAQNPAPWRDLGFSKNASPLAALLANSNLYFVKVRGDLLVSCYNFAQAEGFVVMILLGVGWWTRGRKIFASAPEALLAIVVAFYFLGFTLSYTGVRFMLHLIPYTFGWVMLGLETLAQTLERILARRGWAMPPWVPAATLGLILIPQTFWPIGYDMRGVRYAGEAIAHRGNPGAVIARDGRVAWYAHARFVALPLTPVPSLCQWLATQSDPGYLLIGRHDERRFAVTPDTSCLVFLQRYPRYGADYYDLYATRRAERAP
ncbi:MAG: glycosyltransferase family 39 protein, partial [Candidatus Binataceae bacterium]